MLRVRWSRHFDARLPHFGYTDAFNAHVKQSIGREHLLKSLPSFLKKQIVEDVTHAEAEEIAVGPIKAAKKTSESVLDLSPIGGPVKAYLLEAGGRQKLQ